VHAKSEPADIAVAPGRTTLLLDRVVVGAPPVAPSAPFGAWREDPAIQRAAAFEARSPLSSFAEQGAQLLDGPWVCRFELGRVLGAERDYPVFDQDVHRSLRMRATRCSAGSLIG
jgi:hypothetical protein